MAAGIVQADAGSRVSMIREWLQSSGLTGQRSRSMNLLKMPRLSRRKVEALKKQTTPDSGGVGQCLKRKTVGNRRESFDKPSHK